MSNEMFSDAKVGDKVYCLKHGWGTITGLSPDDLCPIEFKSDRGIPDYYTDTGRRLPIDAEPTLYWGKPEIIAPPKPVRYKNVNGFKVPDIAVKKFLPEEPEYYFSPNLEYSALCYQYFWSNCEVDRRFRDAGLCYPNTTEGEQAAIAHAKAWVGEGEKWEGSE